MSWEIDRPVPGESTSLNCGVSLMGLPDLRLSYNAFVKFIFSSTNGFNYGVHGNLDQVRADPIN